MLVVSYRDRAVQVVERPDPSPGHGEVLVRVRAAGLNGADILQRDGSYTPPPGAPPDILGLELAGEVVEVGENAPRFRVGDRVMGIVGGGGQAELVAIQERQLMPVPEGVGWSAAGGFPEAFLTAHDAILVQGALRPGERLLVSGAAGGVGTAAVQLGALIGAHVTATVRSPDARAAVADLGAHEVLEPEGFAEHGPFDVVLELVGGPNVPDDIRALATNGRIVVIGTGAGSRAEVSLSALMRRRATLRSSSLRSRPLEEKALVTRRVEREVLPALAAGRVRVPVAQTFALDDAAAAYDRFTAGGKVGKVVLLP
jgi:NADPH:quinone reductase